MNRNDAKHRAKVILAILASLMLVSWIDWVTGYESLFFVFYFVPVAICAWHLGRLTTLAISLFCGISWMVVDWLSDHHYPSELVRYWNGFTCFLAFAIVGLVINSLRRSMRELAQALEDVKRTSEEVRKLQSQLQVVCAWTKRIRIDGKWLSLEEFLASKLNVHVSHGISPEAFQEIKKSLE
jgi:hypothetical protein